MKAFELLHINKDKIKGPSKGPFIVTVQQVCAFTALTVRKRGMASENPITEGDFNGFLHVTVRVLNSYPFIK